eukprot:3074843-Lingulodinium_polyedra.AAC.1
MRRRRRACRPNRRSLAISEYRQRLLQWLRSHRRPYGISRSQLRQWLRHGQPCQPDRRHQSRRRHILHRG